MGSKRRVNALLPRSPAMTSRFGAIARAKRMAGDDEARVVAELVLARQAAGLSREDVGRRCGLTRSAVERLERRRRRTTLAELACIGGVVGLDIRMNAYVGGDRIRDAGQQRLLGRLKRELDPNLRWRTEVPLSSDGDRRAWDAVISTPGWRIGVEAETVLLDVQMVERKVELKRRDGGVDHVMLLVADTRRNRLALASALAAFAGFPLRTRDLLAALRAGRNPGASGIAVL
jgi:transcriptional regulator with XRE-family HTH domain